MVAAPTEIVSPRRLVSGDGAIAGLGSLLHELEVATGRVLVVADRTLVELGTVELALGPIRNAGLEPTLYGEVAAEPDLDAVERLEAVARDGGFSAVVGIGGGSALDSAKLAAAVPTNDGRLVEYVEGRAFERRTLPLVLVPTTAGTGAEGSRNSVVAHAGRKRVIGSAFLCPEIALLDATLTVSVPPGVTAASGVDALCHAIESALSTYANAFTRAYAFAAMRTIPQSLRAAYADGTNLNARRELLYASFLAGLSLNAVTVLGHTMGYTIAGRTKLGHGVTCAMSLPYCLAYNLAAVEPMREIAAAVGCAPASLPLWSRALGDELGIPASLEEIGIAEDEVEAMADECVDSYPRPNNPVPFDRHRLRLLYQRFHQGDVEGAVDVAAGRTKEIA